MRVLDECGETWEETEDIGDAAVLVDAAGAVAASTAECPALRPNTVYFAVDLEGETRVWAYSLAGKHKRIEVVEALPTADGYRPPLVRAGVLAAVKDAFESRLLAALASESSVRPSVRQSVMWGNGLCG